jgi:hypothetical protein
MSLIWAGSILLDSTFKDRRLENPETSEDIMDINNVKIFNKLCKNEA